VQLVTTVPSDPQLRHAGIEVVAVDSAQQLHDTMLERAGAAEIVVMCAAVADFRPVRSEQSKLKRRDGLPTLELEPTPNVLRALVAARTAGQIIVGFAAETDHLRENAIEKLDGSGADLIVANDVSRSDAGFEHDDNAVTILRRDGDPLDVPLADKRVVAERVLDAAIEAR
jgi:phosphopantothenoylcysteine decarboxylase/phosphopantothenate--cysteine ligase